MALVILARLAAAVTPSFWAKLAKTHL